MTHQEKIEWMAMWAVRNNAQLTLEGECGFGRECVGILVNGSYPEYTWSNEKTWAREDSNGDVWTPKDAYHKHDCVAVLGRGEAAEAQLYDWLKWFDDNGFKVETGAAKPIHRLDPIEIMLGRHHYQHMVRPTVSSSEGQSK